MSRTLLSSLMCSLSNGIQPRIFPPQMWFLEFYRTPVVEIPHHSIKCIIEVEELEFAA